MSGPTTPGSKRQMEYVQRLADNGAHDGASLKIFLILPEEPVVTLQIGINGFGRLKTRAARCAAF